MEKFAVKHEFFKALEKLYMDNRYAHIIRRHGILVNDIAEMYEKILDDNIIQAMVHELKNYDEDTYLHSVDLFVLTYLFEGIKNGNNQELLQGALLHDIGKLLIPKEILIKNGRLTEKEFEEIKKHTVFGDNILKNKGYLYEALLARGHHERLDGSGYPDGLFHQDINLHLRLLAILDVYSALTLSRPYKEAFSNDEAIAILREKEYHYDKNMLDDFVKEITDLT